MASIGDMPREWSTNFTIDDFICACASRGLTVGQACDEAAARGLGISKASARRIAEQFGTPFRSQVNNQDESALREAETRKRPAGYGTEVPCVLLERWTTDGFKSNDGT